MDNTENCNNELIYYSDTSRIEDTMFEVCPEVQEVKKFLDEFIPKKDKYSEGFLAEAYIAARESKTRTLASVRENLNLDSRTFSYYMKKYPKFAAAVRLGLLEAKRELRKDLEGSLLKRALGTTITESKTEDSGLLDEDGNMKGVARKRTTVVKELPADTNAILELLRKLDPSWNPKTSVDVNVVGGVTQDVNVNIDYRKLSPSALRELLASESEVVNKDSTKLENGYSVNSLSNNPDNQRLLETAQQIIVSEVIDNKEVKPNIETKQKKRAMSEETKEKIRKRQKEIWANKSKQEKK